MTCRKREIGVFVLGLLALLGSGGSALAQTAGMVGFQGLIKDAGGVPVSGAVTLQFRIFDAQAVGNLVDMDGDGVVEPVVGQDVKEVVVTATNGVVSTKFGPVHPIAFDGAARWLELTITNPPPASTLPRVEMVTAPATAEQVNIPATGTPAIQVDNAGNVGIGTTLPSSPLTVTGLIEATAGGFMFPDGTIQTTASVGGGGGGLWSASGSDISYTAGSVGIGTAGPFLGLPMVTRIVGATLPSPRAFHACATNPATGKIYCFGGADATGSLATILEYDPATDTLITKTATLPSARNELACAADPATGKIYCFGGQDTTFTSLNEILEYDPATDTLVTKAAVLPAGRVLMDCAAGPGTGKIYCFGGGPNGSTPVDEILEYDPATDTLITQTAVLPTARFALGCAPDPGTGKIYCFGGGPNGGTSVDEILEYDPATDTLITQTAVLPTARFALGCAPDPGTGKIYCFGGFDGFFALDEILEYDPATDTIATTFTTLPSARFVPLACASSPATGKIYCFGGSINVSTFTDQITEFDPVPAPPVPATLQVGDPGDGSGGMANAWNVFSSRTFKRAITPLDAAGYEDILAKLKATDVVRFRYSGDALQTRHLGVIAEDAPRDIVIPSRKAVSLADYSAFLLAAIKAQQAEMERKDAQLAETRQRLSKLEAQVARLSRKGP